MAQLSMKVWAEIVGPDGVSERREIAIINRIVNGARLDDFGLSLEEGKAIQRRLQEEFTQVQVDRASQQDRQCFDCNPARRVHDYRSRTVHSLFGVCRLRVHRFRSLCLQNDGQIGEGKHRLTAEQHRNWCASR
ncbi:hypothetical protein [Sinorhizobium meliloti]|uniref:hypothetical protein n=1 Tax=Rhizobium meliloti TaxID=382 RepID=UPI0012958D55|nr:hypothetical protein [Sinorhizobium meliloti]MDW9658879.1 hypothetical protein [Sinorhizobium meliloti]MDW9881694.1 hypothetical protein [Sinorhizobium meliloti]MDW9918850.1 hypothetical protein [Sinorhizobium meliloti]MDW9949948.1 hypothetical protein [Sinorhizobium meliloti]